jgi:hypothetical protein
MVEKKPLGCRESSLRRPDFYIYLPKEQSMAATERIGEGLTFEKVWAALMENREQMKAAGEQMKAGNEALRAGMKATDEQLKAGMKATDRQIKAVSEQIGKLGNRFGESVEYLVAPNLAKKFKKLGFVFEKTNRNVKITDQEDRLIAEIDAFLENGDKAMAIESKVKPSVKDVDDHVKRMEALREYADRHNDARKYLGAVAGVVFTEGVKNYALSRGFYVLEPSGDTFTIIEPKGEQYPHEW